MTLNKRLDAAAAVALFVVGVTALAQGALAQIGVPDSDAREWVQKTVEDGGPNHLVTWDDPQVQRVLTAFKKLPASARGPLTTQLYAWAKAVVSTPAFKARYLKTRASRKPEEQVHEGTVDQELKARIAKETADQEEGWKVAEATGSKEIRDLVAQQRKQWAQMRDQLIAGWKADIEDQRDKDKKDYASGMQTWEKLYPPDPMTVVSRSLRQFVDATTDVDFAAKQHFVQGEGGSGLQFVNEAYVKKPWQWKFAYEFGPEAIAAARTAAAAWLKELGK